MKFFLISALLLISISVSAQKKVLDHSDFDIWNKIKSPHISNDGNYILYSLEKGEKDNFLKIKNNKGTLLFKYDRGEKGQFSYNSENVFFTIKPWKDSITELRREKVKKDKLPKDSLGIYNLKSKVLSKIGNIKSYKTPEKYSGYVAYLLENKNEKEEKSIKENKKNEDGNTLIINLLNSSKLNTFNFVTNYIFAKKEPKLAFSTEGNKEKQSAVFILDLKTSELKKVAESQKGKYSQLSFNDLGTKLGFIVDRDTTKIQVRPNELYLYSDGDEKAKLILNNNTSPKGYLVSSDGKISFSEDNSKMYFGLRKPPIVKDTTLIEDEIVNVEVWTYNEPRLYTVQELQVKDDLKKSYQTCILLNKENKLVQLANTDYPNIAFTKDKNSDLALLSNPKPYQLASQWEGSRSRDYALVNTNTGAIHQILKKIDGRVQMSPSSKYVFGYNRIDSTWFSYDIALKKHINLTKNQVFYDELNDTPNHPNNYGFAGWIKDDKSLLIYDRYDIWECNPKTGTKKRLTTGREKNTEYRVVNLDKEAAFIDLKNDILCTTFNDVTKKSGYYMYNYKKQKGIQLIEDDYKFSTPVKAQNENDVYFTKESFVKFPDLQIATNFNFSKATRISDANPQQKDYNWGSIELVNWTSLDGKKLTGMLVKPENFDPSKKYPMLVNFYEKSTNTLNNHRAPAAGRSSINYSFYASRGYVIFNPDIYYKTGYPGESAYSCVIPGITSIIEKGFVDKNRIGGQGHSWGGYQMAYLVTKTNIFKAVESGAPVPNMISAYGGIRWWTGLSRQFQYEHTQSRIGGTPWEYPMRYIENSPIFSVDKIQTPLLIMANDADGHVPWYQGIEFFTALRRLGKPSWFLNYNGEPHWPVKLQNRKDFNIRLSQFFDYYLKDAKKPIWMKRGVPAIEKGINQGLELIKN